MRAKSIEEIREHLARGGRVNAVFRAPEDVPVQRTFEQLAQVNEAMLSFDNSMISHWELLPIEENPKPSREWLERMAAEEDKCVSVGAGCFDDVCVTCGIGYYLPSGRCDHCDTQKTHETPEQRQAWIEKAERDFPVDFEKTWHRKQVEKRLADMPEHVKRGVDFVIPPINISEEQMYPKQQQLYFAALCIANDLKYLRDQLTEKDIGDNPKLIMLAMDSIAIRAEALEEGLLMMHIQKDEPQEALDLIQKATGDEIR